MSYFNDKITNALHISSFHKMRQSELREVIECMKSVVQADPRYTPLLHELYALCRQNEAILYVPEFIGEINLKAFAENLRGIVFPQWLQFSPRILGQPSKWT